MQVWIEKILIPATKPSADKTTYLFMDNCGSHKKKDENKEDIIGKYCTNNHIDVVLLPPNCTPLVQPLDSNINRIFKFFFSKEWSVWWSHGVNNLTIQGNPKAATDNEINGWISRALRHVKHHHIINSWNHTLMGERALKCANDTIASGGKKWEVQSLVKQREKVARNKENAIKKALINR
jgi:hypothetical protein